MKNFFRRDFFKSIAAGGLFALIPRKLYSQKNQASALLPEGTGLINVCNFGAKGDGVTDNTAPFRKAINEVAKTGGPAIYLKENSHSTTMTGNIIFRNGKPEWTPDENDSTHVKIENCSGIVFVANFLRVVLDDGGKGIFSPLYSMIYGVHGENVVVKDNPGRILKFNSSELLPSSKIYLYH